VSDVQGSLASGCVPDLLQELRRHRLLWHGKSCDLIGHLRDRLGREEGDDHIAIGQDRSVEGDVRWILNGAEIRDF
jgi:hypothetical protein